MIIDILHFFCIGIAILIYFRIFMKYREQKKIFVHYLFSINDTDTLYVLGVINKQGKKESRRNIYFIVDEKLYNKYEQTDDPKYLEFSSQYMFYGKSKIIFFVFMILSTILVVIIKG